MNPGGRNDIIESYFRLELDYTEILLYFVLFSKTKELGRRRNPSDLRGACVKRSKKKVGGSGSRHMTQQLVNDCRLVVDREAVPTGVKKILDPEGVELRTKT